MWEKGRIEIGMSTTISILKCRTKQNNNNNNNNKTKKNPTRSYITYI